MGLIGTPLKGALGGVVIGAGLGMGFALLGFLRSSNKNGGESASKVFTKAAVRGYIDLSEKLQEYGAEAREQLGDIIAEIQAEREAAMRQAKEPEQSPEPEVLSQP